MKNDFDFMADQKNKRIDSITVLSSGVKIKYAVVTKGDGEAKTSTYTQNSPEPAQEELVALMEKLNAWVRDYFIKKVDSKVTDAWDNNLQTRTVTFKHNSKGVSAQVQAIFSGNDDQHGELKVPATALYDEDIEGHANGVLITFGEGHTETLDNIMTQARLYLGGKRGAMQSTLPGAE